MKPRPSVFDPRVEQYLLTDEGEVIVDEVVKHPICMIGPGFLTLLGIIILLLSTLFTKLWLVVVIIGFSTCCMGLWHYHNLSMDRFVITNMRVFRVHGVIERHVATVPLTRILDITVLTPLTGMVFNYGHFTFESAAADQGLRKVTYVGDPKERDLTIQRVIQRAGLRAAAPTTSEGGT